MLTEVLVVGSGPAGTETARQLSKRGIGVIVVERLGERGFKRYHSTCAAGMMMRTFRSLHVSNDIVLNHAKKLFIDAPGHCRVSMRIDGCVVDRLRLLDIMKSEAKDHGATFIHDDVIDIVKTDRGFTTSLRSGESIESKYIVGADGTFSVVRERLFGTRPKRIVPAIEYIIDSRPESSFSFEVGECYSGGYSWRFPHDDNVCTGGVSGTYSESEYLSTGGRTIPVGGVGEIVNGHALLVGDAAGMANPISFGGLKAAFLSARKAATAIISDDPDRYQRWWRRSILSDSRFMIALNEQTPNEKMQKISESFRTGNLYVDGLRALIKNRRDSTLLFACFFALKYSW